MKKLDAVALLLVVVGAINWGLVALGEFDLVAALAGLDFGETNAFTRVVYGLVGISGVYVGAGRSRSSAGASGRCPAPSEAVPGLSRFANGAARNVLRSIHREQLAGIKTGTADRPRSVCLATSDRSSDSAPRMGAAGRRRAGGWTGRVGCAPRDQRGRGGDLVSAGWRRG